MPVKIYIEFLIVLLGLEIETSIGRILLMLAKLPAKFMFASIGLMLVPGYFLEFSSGMRFRKISMSLTTTKRLGMPRICWTATGGAILIPMKLLTANLLGSNSIKMM